MWGCPKFAYEAPNQILFYLHTVQNQTKACIAKLSCEISALLRYYAALSANILGQHIDTIFKGQEIQTENGMQMKLTATIFFFGTSSIVLVFKEHVLESSCFHLQTKKHLTW